MRRLMRWIVPDGVMWTWIDEAAVWYEKGWFIEMPEERPWFFRRDKWPAA